MIKVIRVGWLIVLVSAAFFAVAAQTQYPARAVRLIVPYPPGGGTPAHLAGKLFKHMTGMKMVHVPYKGRGPSVIALLSGEVSLAFATTPSVIGHVKSDRLHAIAVTTERRSVSAADLPTIGEVGVPGYNVGSWYGLLAPARTAATTAWRTRPKRRIGSA